MIFTADSRLRAAFCLLHSQPITRCHRPVRQSSRQRHVPDRSLVRAANRLRDHGHRRWQSAVVAQQRYAKHNLALRVSHRHRPTTAAHCAHLRCGLRLGQKHLPRSEYLISRSCMKQLDDIFHFVIGKSHEMADRERDGRAHHERRSHHASPQDVRRHFVRSERLARSVGRWRNLRPARVALDSAEKQSRALSSSVRLPCNYCCPYTSILVFI